MTDGDSWGLRARLSRWLFAAMFCLVCLTDLAAATVRASQAPPVANAPDAFIAPVGDIPLMTQQEKETARESGVASYRIDGMHYVDRTLPDAYWAE